MVRQRGGGGGVLRGRGHATVYTLATPVIWSTVCVEGVRREWGISERAAPISPYRVGIAGTSTSSPGTGVAGGTGHATGAVRDADTYASIGCAVVRFSLDIKAAKLIYLALIYSTTW